MTAVNAECVRCCCCSWARGILPAGKGTDQFISQMQEEDIGGEELLSLDRVDLQVRSLTTSTFMPE
jgi:hypothetical protein